MNGRRLAAAAALMLLLAVPAAAPAAPRGEAKKLVAEVGKLDRAIRSHDADLRRAFTATGEALAPCRAHADELLADQGDRGLLALGYLGLDATHAFLAVINPQVKAAATRLKRLRLRDRALKAYARQKAAETRAVLALPDIDVCAVWDQWKAAGYPTDETAPDPLTGLDAATVKALTGDERVTARAMRRLRKLGVRSAGTLDLLAFPMSPSIIERYAADPAASAAAAR